MKSPYGRNGIGPGECRFGPHGIFLYFFYFIIVFIIICHVNDLYIFKLAMILALIQNMLCSCSINGKGLSFDIHQGKLDSWMQIILIRFCCNKDVSGRKWRQLVEWNLTNTNLKQFMLQKGTKQKHPYIIYTQALIYTDSKKR